MSGPSNNSTNSNSNKFYKHQVSPNNSLNHDSNSSDRMVWEMRNNFRQYYRTPNLTPLLNSPILNEDIRIIDQYQKVTGDSINNSDINGLRVLDSSTEGASNNYYSDKDIVIFDDIEDTRNSAWLNNSHFGNRLVTGFSPTSSHSSHSGNVSTGSDGIGTKNRIIGDIQIADLQGSPRRFGSTHSNETDSLNMEKSEKLQQKGIMQSPINFPKRAPGFPQRIISPIEPETSSSTTNNFASRQDEEILQHQKPSVDPPFDYCYEFSETRKVLDEFFTPQEQQQFQQQKLLEFQQQSKLQQVEKALPLDDFVDFKQQTSATYIGQRLAALKQMQQKQHYEHQLQQQYENRSMIEEATTTKSKPILYENEIGEDELDIQNYYGNCPQSKNFTLSPETTDYDYDSNCGDLDSEFSLKYISSDLSLSNEINGIQDTGRLYSSMPVLEDGLSSGHASDTENNNPNISTVLENDNMSLSMNQASQKYSCGISSIQASLYNYKNQQEDDPDDIEETSHDIDIDKTQDMQVALKDIRGTLERSKKLTSSINEALIHSSGNTKNINNSNSVNNNINTSKESLVSTNITQKQHGEEEEHDTDLETDRLLGQQRMNELQQGGFDDNKNMRKVRCANGQIIKSPIGMSKTQTSLRHGIGTQLSTEQSPDHSEECCDDIKSKSPTQLVKSPTGSIVSKGRRRNKEAVLIEGVLFRARYLGSTQLVCEGQPTKTTRMLQAEEAVSRIKAPEGETQPSTEVDLFISTEKIMVLNTDLKEIMMDHALKTISYIADIGDLVVLMARRRYVPQDNDSSGEQPGSNETTPPNGGKSRTPKMICHVFESDEAQFIAQSIGQAFQVAYMEFLKANGIEDHSFMKEMDYQEVLNSQEIFGDELEIFAKKERQKEVVVPKVKGEILGVVIVESGWGSMLPTVVIANLAPNLPAARCGQLNIGDQIIAINGLSLVGLPLSQCQQYIKNTKNQTAVKFTVVPCAPVVEVKIKRPNTKYQLGFSVQNGVICSLLRGGIAERGGVRVGHRIIEINNQSVVAVPHEKIVNLLATSVGEISMKTMPTSMFRLLTGQENPIYI
ncbi:rho GTPase-activating protein gacG isoform X2 [Chironomus tepperi]|uniref:rho GTPase-activating protein gacG isoform X2 n=1 Tax=Chironomus tepperi TaxID=113505 RepID=UPI00391F9FEE